MCEICHQHPCNVACSNSDEEAVTSCDLCGCGLSAGTTYYTISGIEICENCIDGYVSECSRQA